MTLGTVNIGQPSYDVRYLVNGGETVVSVAPVAPPIALDLVGDGRIGFIGTDGGVSFDYGAGTVSTAWVGPQDGILVRDANHDGQVTAGEIVFSTGAGDLAGLNTYDSNHDGQLSAADDAFGDFAVWQDANSDGKVDFGELLTLTARSIASISLSSDGQGYSAAGGDVTVVGSGSFTRADGSTGLLADAVFATGARTSEELIRLPMAVNNNITLIGAIAAAGLMATSATAEARPEAASADSDFDGTAGQEMAQSLGVVETSRSILAGEAREPLPSVDMTAAPAGSFWAPDQTGGPGLAPGMDAPPGTPSASLLEGTEVAAPSLDSHFMLALTVSMPAAAMVEVGGAIGQPGAHDVAGRSEAHGDLALILADTLSGGGGVGLPDIDSLLDALPSSSGAGNGVEFATNFSAPIEPVSDVGALSAFAVIHVFSVSDMMASHPDMVMPT